MKLSYMQKTLTIPYIRENKKNLELINSAKLQNTKSTHKDQLHFYTLKTIRKGNLKSESIYDSIKRNKILRNKLNQGGKRPVH